MKTLDDAVIELNGVLPDGNKRKKYLIASTAENTCHNEKVAYELVESNTSYGRGWRHVCTAEQFHQRAKELGFVNGYRWGVEYKTGSKQPDLPDDTFVEMRRDNGEWHEDGADELDEFFFASFAAFKITDERYKPADTSYLDKPDRSLDNRQVEVDMVAMMEREFAHSSAAFKELLGGAFYAAIENLQAEKSKSERKKVVDAAMAIVLNRTAGNAIEALYDKGFLKLPESEGE